MIRWRNQSQSALWVFNILFEKENTLWFLDVPY